MDPTQAAQALQTSLGPARGLSPAIQPTPEQLATIRSLMAQGAPGGMGQTRVADPRMMMQPQPGAPNGAPMAMQPRQMTPNRINTMGFPNQGP